MSFARERGAGGRAGAGVPPGLAAPLRRAGWPLRRARPRRCRLRRQLPALAPALLRSFESHSAATLSAR
eukprot:3880541-Alexandrium_andersonii.AAC.1